MWFPVTRGFMSDRLGGAGNFMNVYNKVGPHLKVPTVGNLQVEFRTLYLIAAQKTPENRCGWKRCVETPKIVPRHDCHIVMVPVVALSASWLAL